MELQSIIQLDGWRIAIPWQAMYPGDSFFVPSTNLAYDKKAVRDSAKKAKCDIVLVVVVENDVQGLRVWKT